MCSSRQILKNYFLKLFKRKYLEHVNKANHTAYAIIYYSSTRFMSKQRCKMNRHYTFLPHR